MPQTKQAKKALKQSLKKLQRNKLVRSNVKTLVKKTRKSIEAGASDVEAKLKETVKAIDKATQKGLLKKNTTARRKSRLMKAFNKTKK